MQKQEFEIQIKESAKEIGILLNNKQMEQFYQYMRKYIRMEWKNQPNRHHQARRNHPKAFYWLHNNCQTHKTKRKTNRRRNWCRFSRNSSKNYKRRHRSNPTRLIKQKNKLLKRNNKKTRTNTNTSHTQ